MRQAPDKPGARCCRPERVDSNDELPPARSSRIQMVPRCRPAGRGPSADRAARAQRCKDRRRLSTRQSGRSVPPGLDTLTLLQCRAPFRRRSTPLPSYRARIVGSAQRAGEVRSLVYTRGPSKESAGDREKSACNGGGDARATNCNRAATSCQQYSDVKPNAVLLGAELLQVI